MVRTLGLALMCLAMFSVAGGHWAILQTVAWAQMLRDYSREAPLATAVEKTFSGEHPCPLCKRVEEGRQKEEKAPATVKVDKKSEVFTAQTTQNLKEPDWLDRAYPRVVDSLFSSRSDSPPSPIPISG